MGQISGKDGRILHGASIALTGAVHSNGVVTLTATAHGLVEGDRIFISGIVGMTDVNNTSDNPGWLVTGAPSSSTFTIALTTSQTYTSGGTAKRVIPITQWQLTEEGGETDVTDSESGGNKTYIPEGRVGRSGSFEGWRWAGASEPALQELISLELKENEDITHTCQAFITQRSTTVPVTGADAVKRTYNFRISGTVITTDDTYA